MADTISASWEREPIPDSDQLYRRVHRKLVNSAGEVRAGAFTDYSGAMSTDWDKYAFPEETRQRASGFPPEVFAVVALQVGIVRSLAQVVEHDPLTENRAHTNVIGDKDTEVRLKLARTCRVVIAAENA